MRHDPTTSVSLLLRLQDSKCPSAKADWERFADLYVPLIIVMLRKYNSSSATPLQEQDILDASHDVFLNLRRRVPKLQLDRTKRFRGYIATATRNTFLNAVTKRSKLASLAELEQELVAIEADSLLGEEKQYHDFLIARCFQVMNTSLSEQHRDVCERFFMKNEKPSEIAEALQIKTSKVYTVVSRTRKKLQEELADFLD